MSSYSVYHGGSLHGTGRWSGPHATMREAQLSADECRRVAGGDPVICDDAADAEVGECAYCGVTVIEDGAVPAASDDQAWEQIERNHERRCEWVRTRAHRIGAR